MGKKIISLLSTIAFLVCGGMDEIFIFLLVLMGVDYVSGVITACYGHSSKTENGHLSSSAGFKGILKKVMILACVAVAAGVENYMGIAGTRNIIITGFCLNESLSILEQAVAMGVKVPESLKKILEGEKKDE